MDQHIEQSIKGILSKVAEYQEIDTLKVQLNEYLFRHYCEKGYLSECEPEYCTFCYTNSCKYLKLLREIMAKYDIDLRG